MEKLKDLNNQPTGRGWPEDVRRFVTSEVEALLAKGELVAISTGDGTIVAHSMIAAEVRAAVRNLPTPRRGCAFLHPNFGPNVRPPYAIVRGHTGVNREV